MSCHGLKMAYRNLLKYKLQSVICVLGLAGGLSCFTVCNYMLRKELAWNKQLPHYGVQPTGCVKASTGSTYK